MKYAVSLIGICILFLVLAVQGLSTNPFNTNELSELNSAQRELNSAFIRTGTPHPPLSYGLLHMWNEIVGIGFLKTRMLSILFSLGSIITLYILTRNLTVSFLFAISPPIIDISRLVDKYALFIFLTIFTIYMYKKRHYLFLTLSMILLIQTHFYGLFIIAGLYLNSLIERKEVLRMTLISSIVLLTLLPQAVFVLQQGPYDFPYNEPFHDMIRPEQRSIIENFQEHLTDELKWYGLSLVLLSYLIYIIKLRQDKSFLNHYFFLIVPVLFFILGFFINVRHYQLLFLLPFFIIYTIEKIDFLREKYIILLGILIISLVGSIQEIQGQNSYSELQILEQEYQNETIITDGFYAFAIEYYTDLPYKTYHMKELKNLDQIVKNNTWVIYHIETEDGLFLNNSMKEYLDTCEKKAKKLYYCK